MTDEATILASLRAGGHVSPRELEQHPPPKMSATATRIAVQSLLDRGVISLNKNLLLVVEKLYYIRNVGHETEKLALWWGPDRRGYVVDLARAGLYSASEAREIVKVRPGEELAIAEDDANRAAIRGITLDCAPLLPVAFQASPRKAGS